MAPARRVIAVDYQADLKEVQSDAELAASLSAACQRAPFDRLDWWQRLADHCGLDPLLAIARQGDRTLVLPLRRDGDGLASLANWYTFRWRPVRSGPDSIDLLCALAWSLPTKASRITLTGVPDEDGSATLIERAFRDALWIALREPSDVNHVLPLAGRDFATYLSGRPGPLRTTLKRKTGKVETIITTTFDEAAWDEYEAIYAESWKPAEGSPAFLRDFARAEGAAGRLRLGLARAGGRAVAAQMWTVEGGTAFIHKLAHREDAKPLSPGTVLTAALLRRVIDEDKVDLVDFGTGDDPYKRDWMEQVRPRYRIELVRPLRPANWPFLARHAVKRLARAVRRG